MKRGNNITPQAYPEKFSMKTFTRGKIGVLVLIFVICLYPAAAANMYNYVYNGSSWTPALSTADGQQKYWINMANASYGEVQYNLTVKEDVKVTGNLNVTGISYLGNTKINAENVSFVSGGELFANATSIYYNNGSSIFDVVIKNVPENAVMSFNQASCPVGWTLADGTSGTPDLSKLSLSPKNVSRIRATRKAAQSIPNDANTIVKYNETTYDNSGEYNGTTGNFTAKEAGYYLISAKILFNSVEWAGGKEVNLKIFKNGVTYSSIYEDFAQTTSTRYRFASGVDTIYLAEDDYFNIRIYHNQGGTVDIYGSEVYNSLSVDFLGQTPNTDLIYCQKTAEDSASSNSIWQIVGDLITPVNSSADFAINTSNLYVNVTSGNVGIGTSSPVQKLHLYGAAGAPATSGTTQNGLLRFEQSADTGIMDMGVRNAGLGAWIQSTDRTTLAQNYPLLLNPNGGNVGIGTSSPTHKLNVVGTSNITGTAIFEGDVGIGTASPSTTFQVGTTMYVNSTSSRVGIGTASPASSLEVAGTGMTLGGVTRTSWPVGNDTGAFIDNATFAYYTGGNVGIGTASPNATLHVSGTQTTDANNVTTNSHEKIGTSFYMRQQGNVAGIGGVTYPFQMIVADNVPFEIYTLGAGHLTLGTSGTAALTILDGGNVGIGTASPLSQVHIKNATSGGELRIGGSATNYGLHLEYDQTGETVGTIYSNPLYVQAASLLKIGTDASTNPNQLVLKGNGNVGIGTSTPTSKLQVVGGNLQVSNTADTTIQVIDSDFGGGGILKYDTGKLTLGMDSAGNAGIAFSTYSSGYADRFFMSSAGDICGVDSAFEACSSDARLKENILNLIYPLEKTLQLEAKKWNWNDLARENYEYGNDTLKGFVAQDLIEVYPEWVSMDDKGYYKIDDGELRFALLEGLKQLNTKTDSNYEELSAENDELKQENSEIKQILCEELGRMC